MPAETAARLFQQVCSSDFTQMASSRGDKIWFEDPRGFISADRLLIFVPVKNMTLAEQLNATLRFTLYFTILMLLVGRNSLFLLFPVVAAAITYMMYTSARGDPAVLREGLSGHAVTDQTAGPDQKGSRKPCVAPSKDNPFMNVLQSDYAMNPQRARACDIQRASVKKKAEAMFDAAGSGLVRDADDVFHRNASSRQFVTNASTTIPNDQAAFAHWLYGQPPACKGQDRSRCQP